MGSTLAEVFTTSLAIAYATTYITTDTQTFSLNVPQGQLGVVVSIPLVRRVTGNTLSGCTDTPTVDAFIADSYTFAAFGSQEWVKSPIVMCDNTDYPIFFCNSEGVHE